MIRVAAIASNPLGVESDGVRSGLSLVAVKWGKSGPARILNHGRKSKICSLIQIRPGGSFTLTTDSSLSLVAVKWGEDGPARI